MALWNKVVSGFDREEETVNFGARAVAVKNGSVYETATVATIQADREVTITPRVLASLQSSRVCIAVDKSITIFASESCEQILLSVGFASLINCYCITEDGSFLFVVLATGMLYCLHLLMQGKVVFSRSVAADNDPIIKLFLQMENEDCLNLVLVAKSGIIQRLSTFNVSRVQAALNDEDEATAKEITEAVQSFQLSKEFPFDEVIYAARGIVDGETSIALVCSDSLLMWPSEQCNNYIHSSYKYTKVQFLKSSDLMLCLRTDRLLNLVCARTLLGLKVYDQPVMDFTVIENNDNDLPGILLLIENENDRSSCILRVVSFPEFEEKFQISVPSATYLVEVMSSYDETVLYLEGVDDSDSDNNRINMIRVKSILESAAECQLQRLLRRSKFEEAENFARKFKLSVEPVFCARAASFMSQLGPWTRNATKPVELDAFLEILDRIQNVNYVAECCSKALVSGYKQIKRLHLYARTRILKSIQKAQNDDHLRLLHSINETLHKLETFQMIWGCQRDHYDEQTIKEWIRFSRTSFMDEYRVHLSLGEMEAATLIWSRHLSGMVKKMSVETVREIFTSLPKETSPSELWPWFSHFIPTLLSLVPEAAYEIIFWAWRKAKSLEQSHRGSWPQIGIDFANNFIKLLRVEDDNQYSHFHQACISQNSALKQFILMMQALSDIQKLRTGYRLAISLDAYMGEPIEVSQILLDRIHVDVIPEFAENFLTQYMLNNSLRNDDVFSSYIQRIIRSSKSWWSGEEAPWEKRAVTVISLIQNQEIRLQQTLDILRKAPVPWSSTMEDLAESGGNFDHVLSTKIRAEKNYVPIKLILKKYGYECIGINDKLIARVIRENDKEMISHIVHLTKDNRIAQHRGFSACLNYNIIRGNFKRVMEILNELDDEAVLYCCLRIVNYVVASLSLKSQALHVDNYMEMLGWIKCRLKEIMKSYKSQAHHCAIIIATINETHSLYLLKKEFGVSLTSMEYQTKKRQTLRNYVKGLHKDVENSGLQSICSTVLRVADLLKMERLEAVSILVECTKEPKILEHCIGCDAEYLSFISEECPYVNKICMALLGNGQLDANVTRVIKNLSTAALCACSNDQLYPTLLPYIWSGLYRDLFGKDGLASVEPRQKEQQVEKWRLYPIYRDFGIGADQLLLPLFKDVASVQQLCKDSTEPVDKHAADSHEGPNPVPAEESLASALRRMRMVKADHNEYCLLQTVKTLYFNTCTVAGLDLTTVIECRSIFFHYLFTLLRKLISARKLDLQLGLSCLFMLPETEAYKWILAAFKTCQIDYNRHFTISVLGFEYFRLVNNPTLVQTFKDQKILHCWAQNLTKYSIPYKEILLSDASGKRDILQRVMNSNRDDLIPLLEAFCSNFGFNVHDCLLLYLQTLMKNWNPKLNFTGPAGRKELYIDEEEVIAIRKRCEEIVAKIPDKAAIKNWVTMMRSQVNFYYYELFMILMDIVEEKNMEHRNYFYFLQNYTRNGQPTQIELDEWMHLNPGQNSLPAIAKWRLPFLPKIELWKLITSELNLRTYEKWLEIGPILKLQAHIICTLAIKGEVSRVWGNVSSKSSSWSLCEKSSTLLNDIKKCIERMKGSDALYYGTAALYYVVNHTPPGADQVAAAKECYSCAQLSAQKSIVFEEGMLEKIKFKYLRFTAEHILRTHGLGKDNYLLLIVSPYKLVRELYMDESIPQRYRTVTDHRPDINSAVGALNELFAINSMKLRLELLQEWLQPDHRYLRINQSISDTFAMPASAEQSSNFDDNLLRACYILEHGDTELSTNFLINIGFGDSDEDYSLEVKYRALQVLHTVTDVEVLEDLTKRKLTTIRQYMESLRYIGKLESLGLGYNIETFESCSKHELVQIIWRTQCYSPQALTLITQICIDFEIHDYSLWDKSLSHMAKLSMVSELKKILVQARDISNIVNSDGYLSGWQIVVLEPFRKMDIDPTTEQIENCIETLRLLHSCPVLHMLTFADIITYCFECQQPHLAAALLPFLNDTDTSLVLETMRTVEVSKVLQDLNALSVRGVLLIPYCCRLIEEASNRKPQD